MSRNILFGEIAAGIGEIRSKLNSSVFSVIDTSLGPGALNAVHASFDASARASYIQNGNVFLVGCHKWGDSKAKIGS